MAINVHRGRLPGQWGVSATQANSNPSSAKKRTALAAPESLELLTAPWIPAMAMERPLLPAGEAHYYFAIIKFAAAILKAKPAWSG